MFFYSWSLLNEPFFKSLKSTGFTGSRGAKSRVDLVEDRESVYIRSRGAKNRVDLVEDREIVYIRTVTLKLIANPVFRTTFRGNCHTLGSSAYLIASADVSLVQPSTHLMPSFWMTSSLFSCAVDRVSRPRPYSTTERTRALNKMNSTFCGIWAMAIVLTAVRPFLARLTTCEM